MVPLLRPCSALLLLGAFLQGAAPPVVSTTLLKTRSTWNGAPIALPMAASPEVQSVLVEIAAGASTAWHLHAVNNIAYVLEGSLRVQLEDGKAQEFQAGAAFAEVVGTWHRGTNIGPGPLRILVVYIGDAGVPISTGKPEAKLAR